MQEHPQVETVCVLLNHVHFVLCLDVLVVLDAKVAAQLAIDLYLLLCLEQFTFAELVEFEDLASVDRLRSIDVWL